MGWYEPREAPPGLRGLLACSWVAMPSGRHRLVPDGCVDLLALTSGELVLCGPETTAWTFELPPGTEAVGVRFRPGAASQAFDLDISTIRDRRIRWSRLTRGTERVGDESAVSGEIAAAISGGDLAAGLVVLESVVRRLVGGQIVDDDLAERILEALAHRPAATQAELAAAVGLTPRQLHRRSLRLFGYGTSVLARLLRFQRLLALSSLDRLTAPLARLAVEAGFSDQAHLTRDCRAIAGVTPRRFLAEYFPTFPDMSDPYKTFGGFLTTMDS